MRVTFSYCNLACYVYENMSIYMYNQVNRSQFPNSDQLQSCSNNNFNYTPSTRIASFDEVITKGKKLWSFSNSINYALRNCEISLEKLHMVTGAWRVILSLNKPQYYMHFLFSPYQPATAIYQRSYVLLIDPSTWWLWTWLWLTNPTQKFLSLEFWGHVVR